MKLAKMAVKGRYLHYLGTKQHEEDDIREDCIICFGSSDDNQAVLLQCGHYFCLVSYCPHILRVALNARSVMLPRVPKDTGWEEMPIMSNKK